MNNDMIELCAKALWDKSQTDPANQYKLNILFKKVLPGPISWKEINDVDIIPNVANEYRDKAKIVVKALRKYVAAYSKDNDDIISVFLNATVNEDP